MLSRMNKCSSHPSSWFFLRFFCPAIIFPAQFGLLVPEDLQKKAHHHADKLCAREQHPQPPWQKEEEIPTHRGLVLISKFLQCLANNVEFHAEYEKELNELLHEKSHAVTEYLLAVAQGGKRGPTPQQAAKGVCVHKEMF